MKLLILAAILWLSAPVFAQTSGFSQTVRTLYTASLLQRDTLWQNLIRAEKIPLVMGDSVAFLYRGEASSVRWMGDFNAWGYDKNFKNTGSRIPGSDIWILKASFPTDASLDYKIVVNENNWILDPENPRQQWSGVGGGSPNSALRMPMWKPDPHTTAQPGIARGTVKKDLLLSSKILGYQVAYSVYLPNDYPASGPYPVVYVTDGYEYMHEEMGNMLTILDNLIVQNKIAPVIAVFVDHREPVNRSNNRRMQELAMNEQYLNFFTQELIPKVEGQFVIRQDRNTRAILGTSMGGLTAAYFSFSKPAVFGLCGIQSPAFWFKPAIYSLCDNPENPPLKTFLTTGMIHDTLEGAEKMKTILNKNTCTFQYKEVNQGHSWGNWKDQVDDILIYFFPLK